MKRLESSDSLGALISLCPAAEEKGSGGSGSYRSFQSILDGFEDEDCGEESGGPTTEKKRRLSVDQVKALEKNFEVENKLEPERKVKLAQELGLQPRQVAVWFQNRRARWKTKQLEKDYGMLKANYEALKLSYEALQHVNETLVAEVRELKEKREVTWNVRETESQQDIIKEDRLPVKREDGEEQTELTVINSNGSEKNKQQQGYLNGGVSVFNDFKDGSDSDSSAILNDDNSPHGPVSSGIFSLPLAAASSSASRFNCSSSSSSAHITGLQISESRVSLSDVAHKAYHQFFKMEEHDLLNPDDESCNFFADEQAPTLQWYCSDPWT